jgi:Pregnancy-associated plasma protein-A
LAGVETKQTTNTSWGTNDAMKRASSGGLNPTNPTTSLNIWVCNLSNSILGYAQFPGGSSATDGVVVDNNAFGSGSYALFASFNKGRTATHEVGHWLNLRHIWGDRRCGDDLVGDTPGHDGANYGCPAPTTSKCAGKPVEMTMNYMDYTNDACMYMFTVGQAARMRATFATNGPRAGLRP